MSVTAAVKIGLFVKNNWKPILIGVLCVLMFIIMLPSAIVNLFVPAATPDFIDDYINVSDNAGLSWADLLAYDTVRYNNELTKADPFKSAFDFIIIDVIKYRPVVVSSGKVSYVVWVFESQNRYNSYEASSSFLKSVGFTLEEDSNLSKMNKFLANLSSSPMYDVTVTNLTLRDLLYKIEPDKQSWALSLAENLPQIYANGYNIGELDWNMTLIPSIVNNDIPYYNQHDSRWAKIPYGSHGTISTSGCGPTSVAMIISGMGTPPKTIDLNTDLLVDPVEAAYYSVKRGFRAAGGTDYNLFFSIGRQSKVSFTKYELRDYRQVAKELENGYPVIISVHPGKFTSYGHFMVIVGIDSNGKVILHDPNNLSFTQRRWDFVKDLVPEAKRFFVAKPMN